MRVALVEDDWSQAELFGHWLRAAGHHCQHFERGEALIRALHRDSFDAVALDWSLPDLSGMDVLRRIRMSGRSCLPILVASAHGREEEMLIALRGGADDYMVKPVRRLELIARLEAIAWRGKSSQAPKLLELGAYRVDLQERTVVRHERAIPLTPKDFDLSVLFLRNVGRLLSRSHLRERVWGAKALISARTLDTHVSRIRSRLGFLPEHGWRLAAIYRHGYSLQRLLAAPPSCDGTQARRNLLQGLPHQCSEDEARLATNPPGCFEGHS
jgi:DNA-binding response OmpR family regulator